MKDNRKKNKKNSCSCESVCDFQGVERDMTLKTEEIATNNKMAMQIMEIYVRKKVVGKQDDEE